MIESLHLRNFKSFADATLTVGGLTVVVGVNASGKSNLRDAFRFLHGIGRGTRWLRSLVGKYGEGGYREWGPLRGTASEIIRFSQSRFILKINIDIKDVGRLGYEIAVAREDIGGRFRVEAEWLQTEDTFWRPSVFETLDSNSDDETIAVRLRAADVPVGTASVSSFAATSRF